jgi:uncharacterized protein YegL
MPNTPAPEPQPVSDVPDLQAGVEFADNPEPRCPCVLLLDTSGSMRGERIRALTDGLLAFRDELLKDSLARRRVEIAIIGFGGQVDVLQDFVTIEDFPLPILDADGLTPMGTAIIKALDLVEARKTQYKAHGVAYYRPWIFMVTDGAPEGEPPEAINQAAARLKADEAGKKVAFFAVAVEGANLKKLTEVCVRPPLKLKGLRFVDMFVWLSRSTQTVANSKVGDQVALPPVNWGTV